MISERKKQLFTVAKNREFKETDSPYSVQSSLKSRPLIITNLKYNTYNKGP